MKIKESGSTVDIDLSQNIEDFLRNLPPGVDIEIDVHTYGLQQVQGQFLGLLPEDNNRVVVETHPIHRVIPLNRVESISCPAMGVEIQRQTSY